MELDVTVAICTRNRAGPLRRVLGSLCSLVIPGGAQWEVIVVDNGSSDGTGDVLREFAGRLPLRPLFEPHPGVSWARNRALNEARGRYICWTDDDVLLDPNWLAAYLEAFRRHPEAALFGGPIEPVLEATARPLFERGKQCWPLAGPYAVRSPGPVRRPMALQGCDVPYGANFAVRTAEQRSFPYDERLGTSPLINRLADELDVIYRIMQQGSSGWWVPDAQVLHMIPQERQTLRYLVAYYRRVGETIAWLHDNQPGSNIHEMDGPPLFAWPGSPAELPRQLLKLMRLVVRRTGLREGRWLGFLALYGYAMGIVAHRRTGRMGKPSVAMTALQAGRR